MTLQFRQNKSFLKKHKTILLIFFGIILFVLADLIYISFSWNKTKNNNLSYQPKTLQNQNQASENTKPEESTASNTLLFVGDIMLSRHVGTKIVNAKNPNAPFLETASITKKADIAFANLESPFSDKGKRVTEGMVFKAEPDTVNGLLYAGFDIVSLTNNHFGNQGSYGENYTFNLLSQNNIAYVGAGENLTKAGEPVIIEKNGIKFAFLAFDDINSTYTPQSYVASATSPGVNPLSEIALKNSIEKTKQKADVVIVTVHWGTEYKTAPNATQIKLAHSAIDSGASLVIGHHPHCVQYYQEQTYEKYSGGYIFYSLGNFVFDQMWSEITKKGLIAQIIFKGKNIEKVESFPITIYDYFQPRVDK